MLNRIPRNAIEENSRCSGAKKGRELITEAGWEPKALKKIKNVVPTNMIESLFDVKLEEKSGLLSSVEPSRIVADKHEVVVYAPRLNECTLGVGDNVVHVRGQASGEDFGHNLSEPMDRLMGLKSELSSASSFLGKINMFEEFSQ
jgi:hypothetical protein